MSRKKKILRNLSGQHSGNRRIGRASNVEIVNTVNRIRGTAEEAEIPTMAPGQLWLPHARPTLFRDSDAFVAVCRINPPLPVLVLDCNPQKLITVEKKSSRIVTVLPLIPVTEMTGKDEMPIRISTDGDEAGYAIQLWNPHDVLFHNFEKMVGEFNKNAFQQIIHTLQAMFPEGVRFPSQEQERLFEAISTPPSADPKDQRRIVHLEQQKFLRIPSRELGDMYLREFSSKIRK